MQPGGFVDHVRSAARQRWFDGGFCSAAEKAEVLIHRRWSRLQTADGFWGNRGRSESDEVQEEDGNFHESVFSIEGDGIGYFGSVIPDTVYVEVLRDWRCEALTSRCHFS